MFPEFRDLITQLKMTDAHFLRLFEKHNELDQQVRDLEANATSSAHDQIETLKKEKLLLKDQIYAILKKA